MKKSFILAIALSTATLAIAPAQAQMNSTPSSGPAETTGGTVEITGFERGRAQNLSRQAVERANGGLGNYRAEAAMYGPSAESPYVNNGDGTITFTFKGNRPGETVYSYESVVTVDTRAWTINIDYNGPVRN
jgi:hypothetical protein